MDDARAVGCLEGDERLAEDTDREVHRQPALTADPLAEVLAAQQLHHDHRPERRQLEVEDVADPRVTDAGGDPRLVPEARDDLRVLEHLRQDQLDRHVALDVDVVGQPHRPHAAAAELGDQAKFARQQPPRERQYDVRLRAPESGFAVVRPAVRAPLQGLRCRLGGHRDPQVNTGDRETAAAHGGPAATPRCFERRRSHATTRRPDLRRRRRFGITRGVTPKDGAVRSLSCARNRS